MQETRAFVQKLGLPPGDLNDLPTSSKRFPDGVQYRVEIPSVEGVRVHRAEIGLAHLQRYYPEVTTSKAGASGLGVPIP